MTLDQIHFFIAVADCNSFSDAAEELHISQSSISKAIISLENELGLVLFDRKKKSTSLTEIGRVLYDDAVVIDKSLKNFIQRAEMFSSKFNDSIHIISFPFLEQYGLFDYFHEFERANPDIRLILEEPNDMSVVKMLQKNLCDFALVRDTGISAPEYAGIDVCADEIAFFCHPEHPHASKKSISISDIKDEELLLMKEGLPIHIISVRACQAEGFEPQIINTARIETLLGQVRKRVGSALLAKSIERVYQMQGVRQVPIRPTVSCNVVLAWKNNIPINHAKAVFLEHFRSFQGLR